MKRAVVCVATTERYQRGMDRLFHSEFIRNTAINLYNEVPIGCPPHDLKPYAFKAYAMKYAADAGADLVLWADACILPIRSMEPLWEKIERDGYWICRNGFTNYQWTADSAYPDLFDWPVGGEPNPSLDDMRHINKTIPHVVATSFGLNLRSDIGRKFIDEYYRLASETRAFCGPWANSARKDWNLGQPDDRSLVDACGPPDVLGHRHDQSAASVIAWRLGMQLTDPPEIFAYPPGDERTILLADGSYQ